MNTTRWLVVLAIIGSLLIPAATASSLVPYDTSISVMLGEETTTTLSLTNTRSYEDTFEVTVEPSLENGNMIADFPAAEGDDTTYMVTIGADAQRVIETRIKPTSCTADSCDGQVAYTARSQTTGQAISADVLVDVSRSQDVYGAPALELLQFMLIITLAAGVFLRTRKRS